MSRLSRIAIADTPLNLGVAHGLYRLGFITQVSRGSYLGPDTSYVPTTPANEQSRRLWLELKYRDSLPVLHRLQAISKPSRKVYLKWDELKRVATGGQVGLVRRVELGEGLLIRDVENTGVYSLVEALNRKIYAGEVLCRVMPAT